MSRIDGSRLCHRRLNKISAGEFALLLIPASTVGEAKLPHAVQAVSTPADPARVSQLPCRPSVLFRSGNPAVSAAENLERAAGRKRACPACPRADAGAGRRLGQRC